jgi:hypothetical protein
MFIKKCNSSITVILKVQLHHHHDRIRQLMTISKEMEIGFVIIVKTIITLFEDNVLLLLTQVTDVILFLTK